MSFAHFDQFAEMFLMQRKRETFVFFFSSICLICFLAAHHAQMHLEKVRSVKEATEGRAIERI